LSIFIAVYAQSKLSEFAGLEFGIIRTSARAEIGK
jgi:hypothetical protein